MTPILQTHALSRSFGAVTAAKDLNVSLQHGEIVAVIGANGAGKTTFINMVTGYLPPSSGSIHFEGKPVTGLPPRRMTRLGIARSFQVAQLFAELTVLENLLVAIAGQESSRPRWRQPLRSPQRLERARAVLEEFDVAHYAEARVAAVPQGARKLIDIAMALLMEPRLLLLDEPTSGVSSEEKFPLMETVMEVVRRRRTSVLFVEHDMEIVARYVTRILAFYNGEIIADGAPDEVLGDASVQEFIIGKKAAIASARSGA